MIKAIIWDLEGVILHTNDVNISTSVARRLGVTPSEVEQVFNSEINDAVDRGEFTHDEFWNRFLLQLNLPRESKKHLEAFFHNDFVIDAQMVEDIHEYRKNYKTGLLTNFSDAARPMLEGKWNVKNAFDEIVVSCEIKMIKPEAGIYQYILDKLTCESQEAIFIDDKPVNVEGARAVGIHAFQYTDRHAMNREIDRIISSVQAKE
jgi:putative hydrolase of the HAD superfamily